MCTGGCAPQYIIMYSIIIHLASSKINIFMSLELHAMHTHVQRGKCHCSVRPGDELAILHISS